MLRYSLVLNTFVYMAARSAPWIFAEDLAEREYVIANHGACVKTLAPTYCMWLSVQFSLLALHRRAFTYWTMGKREWAYRDFHKLIRLLRDLRIPASRRGLRVPGTNTFIEGLTAMAELHIGRIYRGQHAHKMALRYFERSSRHLKGWEEHGEIGELVKGSHWRVNLLINEGKANYQLGRVKRSIFCYARAWRAYLLLVETETHATANLEVVDAFTGWLEPIVDDPDIERWELRERVAPLVAQIDTLRTPPHLRTLAADIVMRLGHLLFVLKLPPEERGPELRPRKVPPDGKHDLAARCMAKAAFLDPTSTRAVTDLLKIAMQTKLKDAKIRPVERPDDAPNGPPEVRIADQWPAVSGGFEEAAQVTEYILQDWLNEVEDERVGSEPKERQVALDLLKSFLAHTDSSNVKLAQVYRYLMQKRREEATDEESYSLDFVCMRRYSSFFPFLPRPSAFRAPGGGYFVRVREPEGEPFGIAIDPGPDFLENLYRCGYALADIQMVVITHDHADHLASLDAFLSVLGNHGKLAVSEFKRGERHLAIVGNASVCKRYSFYNDDTHQHIYEGKPERERRDAISVLSFEKFHEITNTHGDREDGLAGFMIEPPATLRVEPVRTWGHLDANGFMAQGFLLQFGPEVDRASILFTGDTGAPPDLAASPDPDREDRDDLLAKGDKGLREAIEEADVVVAHLSTVPLQELRVLADMNPSEDEPKPPRVGEYEELWKRAVGAIEHPVQDDDPLAGSPEDFQTGVKEARFLLKQIQFGFRVNPNPRNGGVTVSPFNPHQGPGGIRHHLYLSGLLEIAEVMAGTHRRRPQLLLLGELREELGTFRTSIATAISGAYFKGDDGRSKPTALTADIGLRVRLTCRDEKPGSPLHVLCTTCDLDNDLVPSEKFHPPEEISEVCVKGEDEGVFYNCRLHNPRMRDEYLWVEAVERYDVFGD